MVKPEVKHANSKTLRAADWDRNSRERDEFLHCEFLRQPWLEYSCRVYAAQSALCFLVRAGNGVKS